MTDILFLYVKRLAFSLAHWFSVGRESHRILPAFKNAAFLTYLALSEVVDLCHMYLYYGIQENE